MFAVAVTHVYMSFCTTHYCEANFYMAIGQLMYKSGVFSGIICIISQNRRNISPCNGFVKKSAYISLVVQYFRGKSPF